MYKTLRRIRITVSVAAVAVLTVASAVAALGASVLSAKIMHMHLMPALLAGSITWIVLWVLATLSVGRVYCATICPMGAVQRSVARASRLGRKGRSRRYRYTPPLNGVRLLVLWVVIICCLGGYSIAIKTLDPATAYHAIVQVFAAPITAGVSAVVTCTVIMLAVCVLSWYKGPVLCNTVCPTGVLLAIASQHSVYRLDINPDKCIHCGKCEDVCSVGCIDLTSCEIDPSRCLLCLDCTVACPNDAIVMRRGRHRLSTPLVTPVSQP